MMLLGEYKLARAAGGVSHFAQVQIAVTDEPGPPDNHPRGTGSEWWNAAQLGAADMHRHTHSAGDTAWMVRVRNCVGSAADTTPSAVWSAAAMAYLVARGTPEVASPEFDSAARTWCVRFRDGTILRPHWTKPE
jgi:hypothetical protein